MSKPFFFRIDASELLAYVMSLSEKEKGKAFTQFALDLVTRRPTSDYATDVIREAIEFADKKREAAHKRWSSKANAHPMQCISKANAHPMPEAVTETEAVHKPYKEILDDLNSKGGFSYRPGKSVNEFINGRLAEGFTKDDFFHVHTVMVAKWKDDEKMSQYLRPSTLYRPTHFQEYLNQKPITSKCITPDWM
jgi:uncharacterized phage protein (TIGR02220 family)